MPWDQGVDIELVASGGTRDKPVFFSPSMLNRALDPLPVLEYRFSQLGVVRGGPTSGRTAIMLAHS